jgi:hypothetical protein
MFENGKEYCDCPKNKCERHGNCKECMEYHTKTLPRCKREKKERSESIFSKLLGKM